MTTIDPEEVTRLRLRAYSRGGTDADRLRLAELESAPAVNQVDEIPPGNEPSDENAPDPQETRAAPASTRRRRVAIAAVAGVIVGASGVALGTTLMPLTAPILPTESPTPVPVRVVSSDDLPSLSVFEREATAHDDLGGGFSVTDWFDDRLTDIDVRWIGSDETATVYAVRGMDDGVPQVCVIVMRTLEGTSRCVPETRFLADGVEFSGMGLQVRWGPTGTGLWVRVS
ncbi:MAG: hypothetical protein ABIR17_01045 [Pseudolysinimonas sp.]|uniref:hypothetical protein n=1 Tax=Pseudolysinimonas sp. TaxID=2680009 RepID=UPI003266BAD6